MSGDQIPALEYVRDPESMQQQLLQLPAIKGWDYIDTFETMYDHRIRYETEPDFRAQQDRGWR